MPGVSAALKPDNVLQHPGYYYYMAAKCTQQRLDRFHAVLEQEVSDYAPLQYSSRSMEHLLDSQEKQPGTMSKSPGFSNEKKVEHYVIIIEVGTIHCLDVLEKIVLNSDRSCASFTRRRTSCSSAIGRGPLKAAKHFTSHTASRRRITRPDSMTPLFGDTSNPAAHFAVDN